MVLLLRCIVVTVSSAPTFSVTVFSAPHQLADYQSQPLQPHPYPYQSQPLQGTKLLVYLWGYLLASLPNLSISITTTSQLPPPLSHSLYLSITTSDLFLPTHIKSLQVYLHIMASWYLFFARSHYFHIVCYNQCYSLMEFYLFVPLHLYVINSYLNNKFSTNLIALLSKVGCTCHIKQLNYKRLTS